MIAIAGDSAAGKTTLASGLVRALGPDRSTAVSVDDYHRYDREETQEPAVHPRCTRTATTSTSPSSTCSCSRPATRS